jgi:hypothetical protein
LDTLEVHEALKPIRERAAESSKARREKERRDRISNRSGFRNSSSSPEASYEFGIQDVKDLFGFKDGGIASFKEGGFADMINPTALWNQGDPGANMTLDAIGKPELKKYGQSAYMFGGMDDDPSKDPGGHGAWGVEEEEELSPLEYVELWQENQRRKQTESKRAKAKSGLSANSKGGIASFSDGGITAAAMEAAPIMEAAPQEAEDSYMAQLMKTYMDSLEPSQTKDYPSKRKLTGEQQRSGAIQSIADALMSVSSDEAGNADFSRMGSAAAASSSKTLADLEAARKEEVAAASARSSSILTGLLASTTMAQEMSKSKLDTVNAALLEQELLHPEWRVQKIAMEALLPLRASGMLDQEKNTPQLCWNLVVVKQTQDQGWTCQGPPRKGGRSLSLLTDSVGG